MQKRPVNKRSLPRDTNPRKSEKSPTKGKESAETDLFTLLVRTDLRLKCIKELAFCPGRKWRFDYALPEVKIAVEVEGGTFKKRTYRNKEGVLITTTGGRHNSATGFLNDMEKYNEAAVLGWRLLRVTPDKLITTSTIEMIRRAIAIDYDKESTFNRNNPQREESEDNPGGQV